MPDSINIHARHWKIKDDLLKKQKKEEDDAKQNAGNTRAPVRTGCSFIFPGKTGKGPAI
jgi:hypothetical protein